MRRLVAFMTVAALAWFVSNSGAQTVKLKDQTYDELLEYSTSDRAILAGVAEKTSFVRQGSRSERVIIETTVIAGPPTLVGQHLQLTRFAQRDPGVKLGTTYLFAAYRGEWAPAWGLVEAIPVDARDAQTEVTAATEELLRRAKKGH